jgi:anthranilate/para-aminobenzoate synthase component I
VITRATSRATALERILAIAETLEPPFILLEDGRGTGRTHLVWGRRDGGRVEWGGPRRPAPAIDGRPWYGMLAYEAGLPEWVPAGLPAAPQPLREGFEPENRIILSGPDGPVVCEGREAERSWERMRTPARTVPSLPPQASVPRGPSWCSFTEDGFHTAVAAAREFISAGDIYQVNLAVAQRWPLRGRPWDAYCRLRMANPSPWMGFADFGDWQLVCGSPELLVEVGPGEEGRVVRTRPIAGTRKKTGDADADARMRAELRLDEKERAEHLMLVDLARNDTGRVSEYGSVQVAEQAIVEDYSHVFHLVSEVRGRLRPETTADDVLAAYFPGGTITGCPKFRAMEIIQQLEPVARGAYTGALGWIGAGGLQLNIVIRSAVVSAGEVVVQAGAGIVADSVPAREWRESLRKAAAVQLAFGLPVRP